LPSSGGPGDVPIEVEGTPYHYFVVEDADKTFYGIDLTTGAVIPIGRYNPDINNILADINPDKIDHANIITFENGPSPVFAFDVASSAYYKNMLYLQHYLLGDKIDYPLRWKFMPTGSGTDKVIAKMPTGIVQNKETLKFIVTSNSTEIDYTPGTAGSDITLNLMPATADAVYAIHAVVKVGDKWQQAGRLDVFSRTPKTYSVTLVTMGGNVPVASTIETELNKIWKPYGITWTVDVETAFYNKSAADDASKARVTLINGIVGEKIETDDDAFLSEYTQKQLAVNRAYRDYVVAKEKYSKEEMYVFVLPAGKTPKPGQTGDMPLGKQWGYLFIDDFGNGAYKNEHYRTLAHELGHGKTKLDHTFPSIEQGTTQNLMDYVESGSSPLGGGWEGALVRQQWEAIHDPAIFDPAQSDEDGAYLTGFPFINLIEDKYWNYYYYSPTDFLPLDKRTFFNYINTNFETLYASSLNNDVNLNGFPSWIVKKPDPKKNEIVDIVILKIVNQSPVSLNVNANSIYIGKFYLINRNFQIAFCCEQNNPKFEKISFNDLAQLRYTTKIEVGIVKEYTIITYFDDKNKPLFTLQINTNKASEVISWLKYLGILVMDSLSLEEINKFWVNNLIIEGDNTLSLFIDNAQIPQDKNAFAEITIEPQMPTNVQVRYNNSKSTGKVNLKLQIGFNIKYSNGKKIEDNDYSEETEIEVGQIYQLKFSSIRGGTATLSWELGTAKGSRNFGIRGLNPTKEQILTEMNSTNVYPHFWFLEGLIEHESAGIQQFNNYSGQGEYAVLDPTKSYSSLFTSGTGQKGLPLFGAPQGFGLTMIDNWDVDVSFNLKCTPGQRWNWKENIDGGVQVIKSKIAGINASPGFKGWFKILKDYNTANPSDKISLDDFDLGGANNKITFTYANSPYLNWDTGVPAPDYSITTKRSFLDCNLIKYFNGGYVYHLVDLVPYTDKNGNLVDPKPEWVRFETDNLGKDPTLYVGEICDSVDK
jgi:hypothetical protein